MRSATHDPQAPAAADLRLSAVADQSSRVGSAPRAAAYEAFVAEYGRPLRRALVARFGVDVGADVTAEAMAYAWEHWDDVRAMANPVGFLYRVAQSRSRRLLRWRRRDAAFPGSHPVIDDAVDHADLFAALRGLSEPQRVAVLMTQAYGWSYEDVAELLEVPVSTVNNHVYRGMSKLRAALVPGPAAAEASAVAPKGVER
jgi:RNA polymerase sigma factor (sigma-70 family)